MQINVLEITNNIIILRNECQFSSFYLQGKGAFFKPLQSSPTLPTKSADDSLITTRKQVSHLLLSMPSYMGLKPRHCWRLPFLTNALLLSIYFKNIINITVVKNSRWRPFAGQLIGQYENFNFFLIKKTPFYMLKCH